MLFEGATPPLEVTALRSLCYHIEAMQNETRESVLFYTFWQVN
jgi:hypothetical protein